MNHLRDIARSKAQWRRYNAVCTIPCQRKRKEEERKKERKKERERKRGKKRRKTEV